MDENLPNKVDQLFNQGLQKMKTEPPEYVWNKIEEGLDEHNRKLAGVSSSWKRYTAAALLLVIGLGILSAIYFRQHAIFNKESVMRNKTESPSVISQYNGDEKPKFHKLKDNNNKKNSDNARKTSAPDTTTKYNEEDQYLVSSNSDETLIKKLTVQSVESLLSPLSVSKYVVLPVKAITDKLLVGIYPKTRLKDRLSITPYFAQEFAGYSLTDNDMTGAHGQEIEEHERNVFSASVGFYINYKINRKWILQSGISYSWSNSNIDSGTSYAVVDNRGNIQYKLNTISGYGYLKPSSLIPPNVGDSVSTANSYSQLHYLTVPLVLSYRIPLKRFSLLIGAGASFNLLTGAEIETKTYGHGDPEKEYSVNMMGLKKVNFGMLVKLDLQYHISSRMGLNVIPCFKNTLSPINLETAITAYPYNFGVGAGITYRF
jgi:hypothetical protein